jgi:hypothetical protein
MEIKVLLGITFVFIWFACVGADGKIPSKDFLIDCIQYINLDKRADRRTMIERYISRIVDMKLVKPPKSISDFRFKAVEAVGNESKSLACMRSHIGVLKHFIKNKCRNGLVFEDDWQFYNTSLSNDVLKARIVDRINMVLPNGYDVIMFSANLAKSATVEDPRYSTKDFLKVKSALSASGYMINASYFTTLLNNFLECEKISNTRPCYLDIHWNRLIAKGQWFVFDKPKLGVQTPSYSDIELKYVNYKAK